MGYHFTIATIRWGYSAAIFIYNIMSDQENVKYFIFCRIDTAFILVLIIVITKMPVILIIIGKFMS